MSVPVGPDRRRLLPEALAVRFDALLEILRSQDGVLVAYSGGVDSSVLAAAAHEALGSRALACIAVSPSLAADELAGAQAVARRIGIRLRTVETHELERDDYVANTPARCYVCKGVLFVRLAAVAREEGLTTVAYGANVDDAVDYRPGARAAVEAGVRAPLAEAGMTKADVRALARAYGLPNWDKPAAPCLATRIPYGQRVTVEKLRQIEEAERVLRGLGFPDGRVRHHGEVARVEVPPELVERAASAQVRDELLRALRRLGFQYVTLDLQGYRSGSLNEMLDTGDDPAARTGRRALPVLAAVDLPVPLPNEARAQHG